MGRWSDENLDAVPRSESVILFVTYASSNASAAVARREHRYLHSGTLEKILRGSSPFFFAPLQEPVYYCKRCSGAEVDPLLC